MFDARNALQSWALANDFSRQDLSTQRSFKDSERDVFRLAVDNTIDQPFVLKILLLDLP